MNIDSIPNPTPLLQRICSANDGCIAIAMCPDFELGAWRFKKLSDHIFDWLPDVALRPQERLAMIHEVNKTLAHCCKRFFDVEDAKSRGEIGEVLLHAICRQEFGTVPFIARLFYKMRTNDSVTSVDLVHVLYDKKEDRTEIWLGEAKLYSNLSDAKYKALKSIEPLWSDEFLGEMKALIGPKIEKDSEFSHVLTQLFADETSLDHIIDKLVIPICIACDYEKTFTSIKRTDEYMASVRLELLEIQSYFRERVPVEIKIICIFVPLNSKLKIEETINSKVKVFL